MSPVPEFEDVVMNFIFGDDDPSYDYITSFSAETHEPRRPNGNQANNPNMASLSTLDVTTTEPQAVQATHAERAANENNVVTNMVKLEGSAKMEEANEESKENAQNKGANFECKVCLETAKEPVVTPCGHLFCWPCLYEWLNMHSAHWECPVCKGEVTYANITPIYGCGSSDSDGERAKNTASVGKDGVKIPPRPRGNRVDSSREQQSRRISRSSARGHILAPALVSLPALISFYSDENVDPAMHTDAIHIQPVMEHALENPGPSVTNHNSARTNADHDLAWDPFRMPHQFSREPETLAVADMVHETLATASLMANPLTSEQPIYSAALSRNRIGQDGTRGNIDSSYEFVSSHASTDQGSQPRNADGEPDLERHLPRRRLN